VPGGGPLADRAGSIAQEIASQKWIALRGGPGSFGVSKEDADANVRQPHAQGSWGWLGMGLEAW